MAVLTFLRFEIRMKVELNNLIFSEDTLVDIQLITFIIIQCW